VGRYQAKVNCKGCIGNDVWCKISGWNAGFRVTTCLENLEMSGNLTAVKEKSCQGKVA